MSDILGTLSNLHSRPSHRRVWISFVPLERKWNRQRYDWDALIGSMRFSCGGPTNEFFQRVGLPYGASLGCLSISGTCFFSCSVLCDPVGVLGLV